MKRILVGLGLLTAVLFPGSGALAATPIIVVFHECDTTQYGHVSSTYYAPANKMAVQDGRASFEAYLDYILDDTCIPGTLEVSVGKAAD